MCLCGLPEVQSHPFELGIGVGGLRDILCFVSVLQVCWGTYFNKNSGWKPTFLGISCVVVKLVGSPSALATVYASVEV